MKILITGGSGFVASHLVKHCLEKGDEIITSVRWNEDLSRMKPYKDKVKIEYIELTDLSSLIRCIDKHRPDVISHLAAQSWVPYSFDNPIYTMKTNIESTLNVLEAVRIIQDIEDRHVETDYKYNPLIHICSSSEFYGKVDRKDLPITENHKANPGNPYGVSKVAGDFLAQLYKEYYDMRIVITRMFTHCGEGRTMMSAENFYAKSIAELENYPGKYRPYGRELIEQGMSDIDEITKLVNFIGKDKSRFTLIHTQLTHELDHVNLRAINMLKKKFGMSVAYGNHCTNTNVLYLSQVFEPSDIIFYIKGAQKEHLDELHAITLDELPQIVRNLKELPRTLGDEVKINMPNKVEKKI